MTRWRLATFPAKPVPPKEPPTPVDMSQALNAPLGIPSLTRRHLLEAGIRNAGVLNVCPGGHVTVSGDVLGVAVTEKFTVAEYEHVYAVMRLRGEL